MTDVKLNTRFGEVTVDSSKIITFPKGIPGFEANTKWTLFHELDEKGEMVSGVVVHLQSLDDGAVALPLTDPALFGFNYELELSDSEAAELKIEDAADVVVLATLSPKDGQTPNAVGTPTSNVFANISAPILINTKSRIGLQKIIAGDSAMVNVVIKA